MAAPVTGKMVYDQEGVFIHSSCGKMEDQDSLIPGVLRVIEKDVEVIVDWRPLEETLDSSNILCAVKDSSSVVEWKQSPKERLAGNEHHNSYEAEWDMVNTVSFKKKNHTNGGVQSPVNIQSKWSFLFSLTDLKSIKQNKEGMGWSYFVFCLKDDVLLPALHFHQGGSELLLECLEKYVVLCESEQDGRILLVESQNRSLSQSFENLHEEPTDTLLQKFKKDPYTATLVNFSKVTNYLVDTLRGTDPSTNRRPPQEMADFLGDTIQDLKINQQEESGFEVITRGLCHALRKEAWKFLLGYFPWNSSRDERAAIQRRKTDEYFRMKLQWKSVSEEQEKRNSRLRDYRSLIEKDVNRTDRTNKFYEGQDNPGLILLHDILMTYCMYDFDLGYVQGMSDLLSPVLYVMENEVDAFWCFVSYMDQMHQNFEELMQGMKTQLVQLSTLLRLLDSGFCSYLEAQDSGYLYFCFRWLLIMFKREFSFHDILRVWEVIWTGLPCQNFHLLICCAILESEKKQIMEQNYGFNEILKHINELSMKLEVKDVLCKAEAISLQMMNCKDLPPAVCEVLGLKSTASPVCDTAEGCSIKKHPQTSPSQNSSVPIHLANGKRSTSTPKTLPKSVHTPTSSW
ncbi:TBC1 domain family member 15 isoform X2 [Hyperolius riggenbachi]|uniref:TBC1 domain family member 15 isoform X2 n=1 Tax=Hyperolius riggenbachi TaxID=752182 RepID=UPI0035A31F93